MGGNTKIGDSVRRAEASGEPDKLGGVGGNSEDVINNDGEDDEVAVTEAPGVHARIMLGAQKTELDQAAIKMPVPQQGCLT